MGQSDSARPGAAGTLLLQGRTEDGQAKRKTPGPGRPRSQQQQLGTHTWPAESPRAPSAPTTLQHNGDRLSGAPGTCHPPAPSKKGLGTEPCRHQTGAVGSLEAVPGVLHGVEGSAPFWHPEEHGAAPQLGQQHERQQVQGMGSLWSTPSPPPSPTVPAQLQHGAITRGRRTEGGATAAEPPPRPRAPGHERRHPCRWQPQLGTFGEGGPLCLQPDLHHVQRRHCNDSPPISLLPGCPPPRDPP